MVAMISSALEGTEAVSLGTLGAPVEISRRRRKVLPIEKNATEFVEKPWKSDFLCISMMTV